ncbi:hypothetical protein ACVB8X_02305, partial [Streptomyces sp. NRAIS4]
MTRTGIESALTDRLLNSTEAYVFADLAPDDRFSRIEETTSARCGRVDTSGEPRPTQVHSGS